MREIEHYIELNHELINAHLLERYLGKANLLRREHDVLLLLLKLCNLKRVRCVPGLVSLVPAFTPFPSILVVAIRRESALLIVRVAPKVSEHAVKVVRGLLAGLLDPARRELGQDRLGRCLVSPERDQNEKIEYVPSRRD